MDKEKFLKILEEMPLGAATYVRIGENDYALEQLGKTHPGLTMEGIEKYNIKSKGKTEGHADAIKEIKEWRNKIYLQIKGME